MKVTVKDSNGKKLKFSGKILRNFRDTSGHDLAYIAKKVGIGKTTLIYWEAGMTYPPADKLADLALFFGVTPDKFYE